jgi:pimeloyl-ACP methyl ester carboxylesterase
MGMATDIPSRHASGVDVQTAARFQQDIARSQFVIIDDAGHMVHEEKPEAVNGAITSFLDAIRW